MIQNLDNCSSTEAAKAESHFRHVAFVVAYHSLFRSTANLTLRFAQALHYSVQPIFDRRLMLDWWRWTHGVSMTLALAKCGPPPASLAPIIAAWREASQRRRLDYTGRGIDEPVEKDVMHALIDEPDEE